MVNDLETKKLTGKERDIQFASTILSNGGIVAIPTETVYGLAANAFDPLAIKKIFSAKGRPSDNPLIVHISSIDQIYSLVESFSETARKLANVFWPGPLTLILPRSEKVPDEVCAGLPSVAVRMPSHSIARRLINACGFPLAAPSANLSGKPSPTCLEHVIKDLDGKIDAVIDGGRCKIGLESTVITLCAKVPRILRPGAITKENMEPLIGEIEIDPAVLNDVPFDMNVNSPGMKYKHYSPNSNVIIVVGSTEAFSNYVNEHAEKNTAALCFENDKDLLRVPFISYGHEFDYERQSLLLFDSLRRFDILGAKTVYVHCNKPSGMGIAIYNRLIRAAGFQVIDVG